MTNPLPEPRDFLPRLTTRNFHQLLVFSLENNTFRLLSLSLAKTKQSDQVNIIDQNIDLPSVLTCCHQLLGTETMDAVPRVCLGVLSPLRPSPASSRSPSLPQSCRLPSWPYCTGLDSPKQSHNLIGSAHCQSLPWPCLF